MRVAIATFEGMPAEFPDDGLLAAELEARGVEAARLPWRDPEVEWSRWDAVVIRSTWDYARRRDEFVAWAGRVGERLHNSPALIRWNSEKGYLGELAEAGFPTVPTSYVAPGDAVPALDGEVVVKPTVSAGARDTGRFSPATHAEALALIERIHAAGGTAMVQPYLSSVDERGECAVVCLDGEPAYALRKRAVLRPDEVAPMRDDAIGAAEVMYDPGLVGPGEASPAELELAREIAAHVAERFGYVPLYARVDQVTGPDGRPALMELEAVEPNLYLGQVAGATRAVADAIVRRLEA
jgi:glutathione synthase/RimK-type ligase-like ATP-grasp enzyme